MKNATRQMKNSTSSVDKLAWRTKDRSRTPLEAREVDAGWPPDATSPPIEMLDAGRLCVTAAFAPVLKANQLDTFDRVMRLVQGTTVRSFPGRNTVRLELKGVAGEAFAVYLKRYDRSYVSRWRFLSRALRWPGAEDEALREWQMTSKLRAAGFETPVPVAVGQEKRLGVVTRSFVITAEIRGDCAHDCLPKFAVTRRREFACELGSLVRRFHNAGFVHKDLYLYHVFALHSSPAATKLRIAFIDLQRVVRPTFFRQRLRVKDLSALAYSALKVGVPRTDLMRFFKTYRADSPLRKSDRAVARRVMKRVLWLRRRRPRHDVGFTP